MWNYDYTPKRLATCAVFLLACLLVGCSKPDPNALTKDGTTQLSDALITRNTARAKALIEQGADINQKDDQGYTALMSAAVSGNTEIVKLLLSKGADVTPKDKEKGKTALMWAANAKPPHPDIVQLLKQAGAKE